MDQIHYVEIDNITEDLILLKDVSNYFTNFTQSDFYDKSLIKDTYFIIYREEKEKENIIRIGLIKEKNKSTININPSWICDIDGKTVNKTKGLSIDLKNILLYYFYQQPNILKGIKFENSGKFKLNKKINLTYSLMNTLKYENLNTKFDNFYFFDIIKRYGIYYFVFGYCDKVVKDKLLLNYLYITKNKFEKYTILNDVLIKSQTFFNQNLETDKSILSNCFNHLEKNIINLILPTEFESKVSFTDYIIQKREETVIIENVFSNHIASRFINNCIDDAYNYYTPDDNDNFQYRDSYFFASENPTNSEEWTFYIGNYVVKTYIGNPIFTINWSTNDLVIIEQKTRENINKDIINYLDKEKYTKLKLIFDNYFQKNNQTFSLKIQKRIQLTPDLYKNFYESTSISNYFIRFKNKQELMTIDYKNENFYFIKYFIKNNDEIRYDNDEPVYFDKLSNLWNDHYGGIDENKKESIITNFQLFYIDFPIIFDVDDAVQLESTKILIPTKPLITTKPLIGYKDLSTIKKPLNDFSNKSIIANGRRNSYIKFTIDTIVKHIYINNTNFQNINNDRYYSINFHNNNYNIRYLDANNKPTSKFFKFNNESKVSFNWVISNGYLFDKNTNLFTHPKYISLYDDKENFKKTLTTVTENQTESEIEKDSGKEIEIKREIFNVDIEFDVNYNSNLLSINSFILKLTEIKEIKS
jgi:hypothetical protein